jgi:hypothetical protein
MGISDRGESRLNMQITRLLNRIPGRPILHTGPAGDDPPL